jgi:hypothetical protein
MIQAGIDKRRTAAVIGQCNERLLRCVHTTRTTEVTEKLPPEPGENSYMKRDSAAIKIGASVDFWERIHGRRESL